MVILFKIELELESWLLKVSGKRTIQKNGIYFSTELGNTQLTPLLARSTCHWHVWNPLESPRSSQWHHTHTSASGTGLPQTQLSFASPGTETPLFWAGHFLSEPMPAQQHQLGQQHQQSCLEGRSRKGTCQTDTAMSVGHENRGQNVFVHMDHIWEVVCVNSFC